MTLNQAFQEFLDNIDKKKYTKSTIACWNRRFKSGQLSYEKMHKILKGNGYVCISTVEVWEKSETK